MVLKKSATDDPGQAYRREQAVIDRQELDCPLSMVLKTKLTADDWLIYKRNGIQEGVYRNLRLGKYPIESTLNLIRKTPHEARDQLLKFIDDCHSADIRSVTIAFGRGKGSLLIKSYLSQWLPELAAVQAFHSAQKHHGGNAVIYLLLRKSEQQRILNGERHAARRAG